jgi:hypothetical protein
VTSPEVVRERVLQVRQMRSYPMMRPARLSAVAIRSLMFVSSDRMRSSGPGKTSSESDESTAARR